MPTKIRESTSVTSLYLGTSLIEKIKELAAKWNQEDPEAFPKWNISNIVRLAIKEFLEKHS